MRKVVKNTNSLKASVNLSPAEMRRKELLKYKSREVKVNKIREKKVGGGEIGGGGRGSQ